MTDTKNHKWWSSKTKLKRNLTVSTVKMIQAFFFLALALEFFPTISAKNIHMIEEVQSMHRSIKPKIDNICLTSGCVQAAAAILKSMNRSVDPCEDFYQFSCGNFIEEADDSKPLDIGLVDITETLQKIKLKIITEPIRPNDLKSIKMAKSFYKSCMDVDKIEEQGIEPLKNIWKSIGGWPILDKDEWNEDDFTWTDSVSMFKETGFAFPVLFTLKFIPDLKNNTRKAINIEQPELFMDQNILLKGFDDEMVQEKFVEMIKILRLFGATEDEATDNEIEEMLNFEIELATIMESNEDSSDVEQLYNSMKFVDLPKTYPNIPLQEILNTIFNPISIHQDEVIIVYCPNYLSELEVLLSKTPKRILANFLIWKFVLKSKIYWPEQIRIEALGKGFETRHNECIKKSWEFFSLALDSLYVRKFVDKSTKKTIMEIVNGIQEEMYKILSSASWIDDETRKNAIDKLKSMTSNLVYPEEILDDKKLNDYYEKFEMSDTDFSTTVMSLQKFLLDQIFSEWGQPIKKTDWTNQGSIMVANAFYMNLENSITIPAGILQKPMFSNDRPQYINYGTIGYVIGHEITHGFDNMGSQFDKDGNLLDWWTEEAKENFEEKNKCIIEQYGNYTVDEIDMMVNGNLTLEENTADNGGAKEAYNAYNTWTNLHGVEPKLPGLQEFTQQQMFWISMANIYCSKRTPENLKSWVTSNSHSLERFRVIGPLSNLENFSNDFNCPLGSNMNPVKKCQVW